ncbi:MAG: flavodoxin family protein [Dehalococcoidia bacterium]|nr:flavodoxin family protein [Dehalococcoidia bacterium]
MTISVLGIAGGMRRGGNSETLLERALDGARDAGADTEFINLLDLSISPCICPQSEDCMLTGVCTVLDDMQALYAKLRTVDLIFIAFPIAFRGVPAQTKALYDRTQPLWIRKYVLGQQLRRDKEAGKALIIATADRDDLTEFDGAVQATRSWLVSLHFREAARLLVPGVVRATDVMEKPDALAEAYELGAGLVRDSD